MNPVFNFLTKPFNPEKTNDSSSILDSLLFTAENNWGISQEQIMENMDKIAFHESKGAADAIQQSSKTKSGEGPGRGLFQFEVDWAEEGEPIGQRGAHTAVNRLISQLGYTPEFLEGIEDTGYDVSVLSPEQQQMLFLGNLLQMPHKQGEGYMPASFAGIDTDEELAQYWAQHHQAGTKPGTDEYETMIDKFTKDVQHYK